jgi:transposase
MSYTTIHNFWQELAELHLSRGQLAKVVQKVSRAIRRPYEELCDALAGQDHLGIDESGHKDSGRRHWTWCFRAPHFTVFHIDPSRGSQVLRAVLGETFGGVIGCDYFSAYHKYMADSGATVQFCMAHLIRDIRFLAEHSNVSLARWGKKLLDWMRKLFHTLHRRDQYTPQGFARRMDAIRREFLKQVRHPPSPGINGC